MKSFSIIRCKHPLPISDDRYDHEHNLRRILSAKKSFQGMAAITKGDAWVLEEIFLQHGRECVLFFLAGLVIGNYAVITMGSEGLFYILIIYLFFLGIHYLGLLLLVPLLYTSRQESRGMIA